MYKCKKMVDNTKIKCDNINVKSRMTITKLQGVSICKGEITV